MITCPNCHNKAMSQLRKAFLGPSISTHCRSCGAQVSASWWSMLEIVLVPVGITIACTLVSSSWIAPLLGVAIAAVFMFPIHAYCVPIVTRGSNSSSRDFPSAPGE